ncbi:MAG TPA: type II secretion system F family protein, partial [Opitutaceae bacterium]|nr:type II secretion system F family protein [Opitutaceae bacterium]
MAFISNAALGSPTSPRAAQSQGKRTDIRAAQSLARQRSLERKAKNYRLPLGELAIFTQQIASLLNAGLPLVQCLEALQDQTEDAVFRVIIRDVRADISS